MTTPYYVLAAIEEGELPPIQSSNDVNQAYRQIVEALMELNNRLTLLFTVRERDLVDPDRLEEIKNEVRQYALWLLMVANETWVPLITRSREYILHLFGNHPSRLDPGEESSFAFSKVQGLMRYLFNRTRYSGETEKLLSATRMMSHVFIARELADDWVEEGGPDWLLDFNWVMDSAMWPRSAIFAARQVLNRDGLLTPSSETAYVNLRDMVVGQILDIALSDLEEPIHLPPSTEEVQQEFGEPRWVASHQAYRGYLEDLMRQLGMIGLADALALPWYSDDLSEVDDAIAVINDLIDGAGIPYFLGQEDGELFVMDVGEDN